MYYVDDPMAIMIPYPELDSTISAISRPFHYEASCIIHIDNLLSIQLRVIRPTTVSYFFLGVVIDSC